eukprot:scaffold48379_cov55-Attheya_sp.AAC.6
MMSIESVCQAGPASTTCDASRRTRNQNCWDGDDGHTTIFLPTAGNGHQPHKWHRVALSFYLIDMQKEAALERNSI